MAENLNIYTMHTMMEQYHNAHNINSPYLAKELNANGMEIVQCRLQQQCGDDDEDNNTDSSKIALALQLHREALSKFEWDKRNALLYDHVEQSKEYAIEMACTLGIIGNLLRRMNDFVGAAGTCKYHLYMNNVFFVSNHVVLLYHECRLAFISTTSEVYKACLDNFLVGLIDGGDVLQRKLLEWEYDSTTTTTASDITYPTTLLGSVDRNAIGTTLSQHPEFQKVIQNISQLVCEMQCIKFVGGKNAASSRRRRRMVQYAAREENLKNAVKSMKSMTAITTTSSLSPLEDRSYEDNPNCFFEDRRMNHRLLRSQSLPTAAINSNDEFCTKRFWEKTSRQALLSSSNRPRPPVLRRALTSDEEYDQYKALSYLIIPAEKKLLAALNRFPLPTGIVENEATTTSTTSFLQFSTSISAVVDEIHLSPSQRIGGGYDGSREVSERVAHKLQNPIEEDTAASFPSMAFVFSMNFNNGVITTTSSSSS